MYDSKLKTAGLNREALCFRFVGQQCKRFYGRGLDDNKPISGLTKFYALEIKQKMLTQKIKLHIIYLYFDSDL